MKMFQLCLFYTIFLSFLNVINVNSMSLSGPVSTRYDPCGLGVIHFDRVSEKRWTGYIHFGLYTKLYGVFTEIYFDVPVVIYRVLNQTTFDDRRTTSKNLFVRHVYPLPKKYVFNLEVNDTEIDIPIVSKFVLNNVVLCSNEIKASQTVNSLNVTSNYSNKYDVHICGRRSLGLTELVSTGTEAKAGDWPWHVAVLIKDPVKFVGVYDCGGNIISRTTVLTSGHCIHKHGKVLEPYRVVVVAGTNNYKDITQIGRQELIAKKLILHPAYNSNLATSDLGIIKVDKFVYTEYVQPICLWGPAYDKTELFNKEATIIGFGLTEKNQQSDVLRSATTLIQNDTACIDFRPEIYTKLMNEFTFCAGYGPNYAVNPRNGDSGGGLFISALQSDHMISWMLRGVLSKCGIGPGETKCDPTYYVVYTDIGPHYGWINHHANLEFRVNVPN